MASQIRQNYHEESEAAVNKFINLQLYASYTCMSKAAYYFRDDVALPGFAKFFKLCHEEEYHRAVKLVKYQNMRGGRVVFQPVDKPDKDEWGSGFDGLSQSLNLQKTIYKSLLELYQLASNHNDPHLEHYIENELLDDQVRLIKKLGDYVSQCKRAGRGLGEWEFDRMLLSKVE